MEKNILQVGTFEVNCSLLNFEQEVWIVDPGAEATRIAAVLSQQNLVPTKIILTHAHFDHIGAINDLQKMFPQLPVFVHPEDAKILTHPLNCFPPDYPGITQPTNLHDCRELSQVRVLETPGHTPGGCCYFFADDRLLFAGDTLFAGSIGRTDLPGGDMATLMQSLEQLKTLPDETVVIPGHGLQTTIGREKASNPFL